MLLCREELGGLSIHFVGGQFEGHDADEHEADDDSDFENDPERRPYMCLYPWVHDLPLCGIRVVCFAEVLVVCDVPCLMQVSMWKPMTSS